MNEVILAALTIVITRLLRLLKWDTEGIKAAWLTMGVALLAAIVNRGLTVGFPNVLVCEMVAEPVGFLTCLSQIITAILAEFGVIFGIAQGFYHLLRRQFVGGRSILGRNPIIANVL